MSSKVTAREVADWIAEVNSREVHEQPLGWIDGRYHSAGRLAYIWRDEHDDDLSVHQMAGALRQIRDAPDEFDVDVQSRHSARDNKHRWQVYQGVFANV